MGRIDTDAIKTNVDLVALAGKYTELRKVAAKEYAGPCPKCGGTDRFHVTAEWFFCRQCHAKRGDAIEFIQWMDGTDFLSAVDMLGGPGLHVDGPKVQPAAKQEKRLQRPSSWPREAATLCQLARATLWSDEGQAGRDYLHGRGLTDATIKLYGLGYLAETPTKERAPAIVMPWYRDGQIEAVRFRFLVPPADVKIKSYSGSQFGGLLYGGHVIPLDPGSMGDKLTLIICEGEINAMSIRQAVNDGRVDVLSLGSETARLSDAAIAYAAQYGTVITWFDRPGIADQMAAKLPGAVPVSSYDGDQRDANDLLRAGLLGGFMAAVRVNACESEDQKKALLWDLQDSITDHDDGGIMQVVRGLSVNMRSAARSDERRLE